MKDRKEVLTMNWFNTYKRNKDLIIQVVQLVLILTTLILYMLR